MDPLASLSFASSFVRLVKVAQKRGRHCCCKGAVQRLEEEEEKLLWKAVGLKQALGRQGRTKCEC